MIFRDRIKGWRKKTIGDVLTCTNSTETNSLNSMGWEEPDEKQWTQILYEAYIRLFYRKFWQRFYLSCFWPVFLILRLIFFSKYHFLIKFILNLVFNIYFKNLDENSQLIYQQQPTIQHHHMLHQNPNYVMMTSQCTDECKVNGCGDGCWMPNGITHNNT